MMKSNERYVVLYFNEIVSDTTFPDKYSAEIWALQKGYGYYVYLNKIGDKKILLKNNVSIQQI